MTELDSLLLDGRIRLLCSDSDGAVVESPGRRSLSCTSSQDKERGHEGVEKTHRGLRTLCFVEKNEVELRDSLAGLKFTNA